MPHLVRLIALLALLLGLGSAPASADAGESTMRRIAQSSVAAGVHHTCVLLIGGKVRCWGDGFYAALGLGNTESVGDDEHPSAVGAVRLGGKAVAITAGSYHTCALLRAGTVRCWGTGVSGRLGYGDTETIGDDETPSSAGKVPLGGRAKAITAGEFHTCALLRSGRVRCWGYGGRGALGYGNTEDIGDDEPVWSAGDVEIGGRATAVTAGRGHTCALLRSKRVLCWGDGAHGVLGHANTTSIGDDEPPTAAGSVPLGGRVFAISAGRLHTCALLVIGSVRCWGRGDFGRLGYGNTDTVGDNETPNAVGPVPLGGTATSISASGPHTCALVGYRVRCWGYGGSGALGYGNTETVGDDETPASAGNVRVGRRSAAVVSGHLHTCALAPAGSLRCWGDGAYGKLGYGTTATIGDDEVPSSRSDVQVGGTVRVRAGTQLTMRRAPRRDRRAPYRYRIRGSVKGPFAKDAATCNGRVKLLVKKGRRTIITRQAMVRDNCRYDRRLVVRRARLPVTRRTKLRIKATYSGSLNLERSANARIVYAR